MPLFRIRSAVFILAAGIGLSGCATYDPYGYSPYGYSGVSVGYGVGYNPYGYSQSGYGYGSPYGYSQSGYGYGSPYGYGYGSAYGYGSPFGWYDGFYYPGTGYYVYDSARRPQVWSDSQHRYWSGRRTAGTSASSAPAQNWSAFTRVQQTSARPTRVDRTSRVADRTARIDSRKTVRDVRVDARNRRRAQ